jgi:hypothetical protein
MIALGILAIHKDRASERNPVHGPEPKESLKQRILSHMCGIWSVVFKGRSEQSVDIRLAVDNALVRDVSRLRRII